MRPIIPVSDTIGSDNATREMNNFDKWIRITYAEGIDFDV
jgi:hypothetical protein